MPLLPAAALNHSSTEPWLLAPVAARKLYTAVALPSNTAAPSGEPLSAPGPPGWGVM